MLKIIHLMLLFSFAGFSKSENIVLSKDIPRSVLEPCLDHSGRIAEPNERWNFSDSTNGLFPNTAPRSRLIKACKSKDQTWTVLCETGGYTIRTFLVKGKLKSPGVWERGVVVEERPKDISKICEG